MAETTTIGWCDRTFNPWIGCTKVSPACAPCYAEAMDKRTGGAHWGPHAPRRRTSPKYWNEPLKWNREDEKAGVRSFVFCASMADVFDNQVDDAWRDDLWRLIEATPQLIWLLLTKRPQNIKKQMPVRGFAPNVALGTTIATQDEMRNGVALAEIPALFRFYSMEPLLEPVKLTVIPDWVIVGGMSGPSWRDGVVPEDWARALRDETKAAGSAFYFKQWSALRPKGLGCELDGRTWKERPAVPPRFGGDLFSMAA